jgi:hypothetical protein
MRHRLLPCLLLAAAVFAPAAAAKARTITVTEREFSLRLSSRALPTGPLTLVAVNRGHIPHALAIAGPGVKARTAMLAPGASARLTVRLRAGAYTLWCPVGTHASLGMKVTLAAGKAATAPAPAPAPTTTSGDTTTTPGYGGYNYG